ncbi:hypothetical protein BY998_11674 [Methylobacterium sp. B4]|nr:hypothetical protein BY998_11674 [Methylobacterium sp. B4]
MSRADLAERAQRPKLLTLCGAHVLAAGTDR